MTLIFQSLLPWISLITFYFNSIRFKCPFLRGEVDPLIENHSTIEHLMSDDMDHWLANLYFEIIKLPRICRKLCVKSSMCFR